jgi:NAD(P)-dependent dehydrogenase (short-subunit alcohol dehydrogenase family)
MDRLTGTTAIITGAGSLHGIGFATARRFLEEGASVLLTDIDDGVLARADALGPKARASLHDVTRQEDWDRVFAEATEAFGPVRALINNAAITLRAPIHEMSLDTYHRVVSTNLDGTFYGCRTAIATMLAQGGGGSIVNLASINSVVGLRNSSAYGASKGGIRSLTKVVAMEGAGHGIRCNTVVPGMIMTDIHRPVMAQTPELHRSIVDAIPLGRMGDPSDIAAAIAYLASDDAGYVTGSEIIVDGGFTAQ